MPKLVIATQNPGKQKEFRTLLAESDWEVITLDAFPELHDFDVEETGDTFEANALLKAEAFSLQTGLPAVSDDSGLEVEALNNQPGVHSKRFHAGSDADRCRAILTSLAGVEDRRARFVSLLCLYDAQTKTTRYFKGTVEGTIAQQIAGTEGFGFDPIFIPEGQTKTFAELGADIKNQLSHRARALIQLKTYLKTHHQVEAA